MTQDELKLALEKLADRFSEGWHEGIKIDASDIMLLSKAAEALAQPEQEPVAKYCCHLCFNKSGQLFLDRMILCPECGNKRCPKATHHELPCTNSNEPNQEGSVYTTPPRRTWVGLTDRDVDGFVEQYWDNDNMTVRSMIRAIEAKLKQKNHVAQETNS